MPIRHEKGGSQDSMGRMVPELLLTAAAIEAEAAHATALRIRAAITKGMDDL